ncbi:MAG: ThuA domain-containing protein [Verrucomicrobia bacterium]|nr:ThuA domain-containing protein [Verrucomicrobiota bacterium]
MISKRNPLIFFHVGGPDFHPVADQARLIQTWLGDSYDCAIHDNRVVFDHLQEADLLVLMGLFYSGSNASCPGSYTPLEPRHEEALSAYVASGRPVLLHHGAIASYDDSEVFKRLIGINWVWSGEGCTAHSPIAEYRVSAPPSAHPVIEGVGDYTLIDELYYNLHIHPRFEPAAHAWAEFEGQRLPMVFTGEGGRGTAGAGKLVYLANGHDLRAFECPAMRQLWTNSVRWLLS